MRSVIVQDNCRLTVSNSAVPRSTAQFAPPLPMRERYQSQWRHRTRDVGRSWHRRRRIQEITPIAKSGRRRRGGNSESEAVKADGGKRTDRADAGPGEDRAGGRSEPCAAGERASVVERAGAKYVDEERTRANAQLERPERESAVWAEARDRSRREGDHRMTR